jgi:hypothetical protein
MLSMRRRRDPWWDLEGVDARRNRQRRTFVGSLAFAVAVVACGLTIAAWVQVLLPVLGQLGLG